MAKKIATFSNGTTDVYNGKRDVKAAWAIMFEGRVLLSGHSLDAAKAQSTANSNVSRVGHVILGRDLVGEHMKYRTTTARHMAYMDQYNRSKGFRGWKDAYEARQRDVALARSLATIEIVNLD